jgi:transposase
METLKINKIMAMLGKIMCITLVKRVLCVILLAFEVEKKIIGEKLNLSAKSIKKYEALLNSDDLESLLSIKKPNRTSKLEDYAEVILSELEAGEYRTLRQIQSMIEKKTGLVRSRQRINVFLKKKGIVLSK